MCTGNDKSNGSVYNGNNDDRNDNVQNGNDEDTSNNAIVGGDIEAALQGPLNNIPGQPKEVSI